MASPTVQDAREYLDRWRILDAEQVQQLRATTMEIKLRQLASLMASRDLFGNDSLREQEVLQVRERWARVRLALCD